MTLVNPKRFFVQEINKIIESSFFFLERQHALLMRVALIAGVLILAPALGLLAAQGKLSILAVAVAAVPLVIVVLQFILPRFDLAPLIILFAAAFLPLSLPTGTESRLVDSLLLTIFFMGNWIFKMLLVDKRLHLEPSPVNKPLLGFMGITLIALVWSMVMRDPLVVIGKSVPIVQTASAVVMIMLPGAFLLVGNHIPNLKLLGIMVIMMLVAGAIAIPYRLELEPILLINDSGLFTMWVVSLSLGLALFHDQLPWQWRGILLSLAAAWIYIRFIMQISWLAGWLPTLIGAGLIVFMRSKKLFVICLLAGVIFVSFKADYFLNKVLTDESNESGNTRMAAWEVNWRVTGKHLLFGTGPGGYATYYMSYFPKDAMATHNNYIDVIAQTGVFGLALCVWFFVRLAWLGYKLCLRLKGQNNFAEALANAALAGTVGCIVAMAIGDWLFPFAYTQTIAGYDYVVYSWLFMGAILVLDRLYPAVETKSPELYEDAL